MLMIEAALDLGLHCETAATEPSGNFGEDVIPILLLLAKPNDRTGAPDLSSSFSTRHLESWNRFAARDVEKFVGGDDAFGLTPISRQLRSGGFR